MMPKNRAVRALGPLSILLVVATAHAEEQQGALIVTPKAGSSAPFSTESFTAQNTTFSMLPSVVTAFQSPYGVGIQTLDLNVACVLLPYNLIVPDCDITIDWLVQSGSGGHEHNTDRPPGSIETENRRTGGSINPSPPGHVVDNSGSDGLLGITYTSPEASGVTQVTLRGVAVLFGVPVRFGPNTFTIGVRFGGLAFASGPGLDVVTQSNMHNGNNGHASTNMHAALLNMTTNFSQRLQEQGTPPSQVPNITINALSLPQGGLFDFAIEWLPPHESHRFGQHADVRIRNLNQNQQLALAKAIRQVGMTTPYSVESPSNPDATHWHAAVP